MYFKYFVSGSLNWINPYAKVWKWQWSWNYLWGLSKLPQEKKNLKHELTIPKCSGQNHTTDHERLNKTLVKMVEIMWADSEFLRWSFVTAVHFTKLKPNEICEGRPHMEQPQNWPLEHLWVYICCLLVHFQRLF